MSFDPRDPAQREELEQDVEAASPGPWWAQAVIGAPGRIMLGDRPLFIASEAARPMDAVFVAAARSAIPALLESGARLRALLREVEWSGGGDDDHRCLFCFGERDRPTTWHEADPDKPGETRTRIQAAGHTPDCRLAAELKT